MPDLRPVIIYALSDPDTQEIRYIGQTINLKTRLLAHMSESSGNRHNGPKARWIRSLVAQGKRPNIVALYEVSILEANEAERSAMKDARESGAKLLNVPNGITGGLGSRSSTAKSIEFSPPFLSTPYKIRDIPKDLWDAAKQRAFDDGVSLRELVLNAIEEHLAE